MNIRIIQYGVVVLAVALLAVMFFIQPSVDSNRQNPAIVVQEVKAVTGGGPEGDSPTASALSMVELNVQGMSCSGCINEIKSSLSGLDGIGDVLVDLSTGRVDVYFDAAKLKDVGEIASAISAVGYPAEVKKTLTAQEVQQAESRMASRSRLYVAAVGDWEISREDYDTELAHAKNRYTRLYGENVFSGDRGNQLLANLKSQVLSRLIDEGIQLREIRKAGFKLPPAAVQTEFDEFLLRRNLTKDRFRLALDETGYPFDYFMKKFENRVAIESYVEENVLGGISNDVEKRQAYQDWFNNARLLSRVSYYDRELETAVKNAGGGSGCGNGCSRQ